MTQQLDALGSCALIWLRSDQPRDRGYDYWLHQHGPIVANVPGVHEYRQHQLDREAASAWPLAPDLEEPLPVYLRPDGIAELTWRGPVDLLRSLGRGGRAATRDVANVIERTVMYSTRPNQAHWLRAEPGTGARTVVLLRRRAGVKPAQFREFVLGTLAPALERTSQLSELRLQLFLPYREPPLRARGVRYDNPKRGRYHAALFLGAASSAALSRCLQSSELLATLAAQRQHCSAIHELTVQKTSLLVSQGRRVAPSGQARPRLSIEPVVWHPPPMPERARSKRSQQPFPAARLIPVPGRGPEDVVADGSGQLLCGVEGGRILRVNPETRACAVIGDTRGRPLGLEVLPDGRVLVCDALRGLLRLEPDTGRIEVLCDTIDGVPLRFCSNVTAARDGTIWFTQSSRRFDLAQHRGDLLEHRGAGRLYRRDPRGSVEVVLDGLHFPNGIALTRDESALILAETGAYQLSRVPIAGSRAGQRTIIAENLPAFPDNMSRAPDGSFWVAMATGRDARMDVLSSLPPLLRKLVWTLPESMTPMQRTVWVMAFDEQGKVLRDLQTERGDFHMVTGAVEQDGVLYLSSLLEPALLAVDLRGE